MNNRIDLADIYGLKRRDGTENNYSNTTDMRPPTLAQLSDSSQNEPYESVAENEPDLEACKSGRCRFSNIPHIHTDENNDNTNDICPNRANNNNSENISSGNNMRNEIIEEFNQPYPITAQNIQYMNTFIRSQVGRRVHVEFLVGGGIVEKNGYLMAVGANFILLNPIDSNDMIACDFYNIKFMRFYY